MNFWAIARRDQESELNLDALGRSMTATAKFTGGSVCNLVSAATWTDKSSRNEEKRQTIKGVASIHGILSKYKRRCYPDECHAETKKIMIITRRSYRSIRGIQADNFSHPYINHS